MKLTIESAEFLLLVAALVAMLARRIRIPYTVILVATGSALSFFSFTPQIELSRELIHNLPVILVFIMALLCSSRLAVF